MQETKYLFIMVKRNMRRMRSPPHSYKNVIIKIIIPFSQSLFELAGPSLLLQVIRVAIHEAMEQQIISIAKAGRTTGLNSRTSVMILRSMAPFLLKLFFISF